MICTDVRSTFDVVELESGGYPRSPVGRRGEAWALRDGNERLSLALARSVSSVLACHPTREVWADMASSAPMEVIQAFHAALAEGDVTTARDCWANDAVLHVTGRSDLSRDYEPASYFAMLGEWAARYPDYTFQMSEVGQYDNAAVFFVESTGGMAPGPASGLMVYRVTAGKIAEGWTIPAFGDGEYLF